MKELHNFLTGIYGSLHFGCSTDKTLKLLCFEAIVRFFYNKAWNIEYVFQGLSSLGAGESFNKLSKSLTHYSPGLFPVRVLWEFLEQLAATTGHQKVRN